MVQGGTRSYAVVQGGTGWYEKVRRGGGLLRTATPSRVQAVILDKSALTYSEVARGQLKGQLRTATVGYKEGGAEIC